jgi:hypothetical protein
MSTAHGNCLTRLAAAAAVASAAWLAGCTSTPGTSHYVGDQRYLSGSAASSVRSEQDPIAAPPRQTVNDPQKPAPTNVPDWLASGKRPDPYGSSNGN